MSWNSLTSAPVLARLTRAEAEILRTTQLATGQADPLTQIMADVEAEVRAYIAGGGKALAVTGIPDVLLNCAASICVLRLASRFPNKGFSTDERKEASKEAYRLLDRVSDDKLAIEEPTSITTAVQSFTTPKMNDAKATETRWTQEGLSA